MELQEDSVLVLGKNADKKKKVAQKTLKLKDVSPLSVSTASGGPTPSPSSNASSAPASSNTAHLQTGT